MKTDELQRRITLAAQLMAAEKYEAASFALFTLLVTVLQQDDDSLRKAQACVREANERARSLLETCERQQKFITHLDGHIKELMKRLGDESAPLEKESP